MAEGLDRFAADITSKCDWEILCVECDVRLYGKSIKQFTCIVQFITYLCEVSNNNGIYFTNLLIVLLSDVKINEYVNLDIVM
jgi:hypothetical protein